VYHRGEPEKGHQLGEATNNAPVGIRNDVERMQWQYSMARRLAARIQHDGRAFRTCVVVTLKLQCCCTCLKRYYQKGV
jgi:hypothetical protein